MCIRDRSYALGTAESNEWGEKIATMLTEQSLLIGTVKAPFPTYHRNALKNFTQFKTTSYEYYRTYPYLATQWWLDE